MAVSVLPPSHVKDSFCLVHYDNCVIRIFIAGGCCFECVGVGPRMLDDVPAKLLGKLELEPLGYETNTLDKMFSASAGPCRSAQGSMVS